MKYAFHLHAVRSRFRASYPTHREQADLFREIAAAGFDGVDVSDSWGFSLADEAAMGTTRTLAEAHGLVVGTVSCMGKTLCHPELGAANLRALEHALDVACWLQCTLVNVALAIPRTPGIVPVMGARHSPGGSKAASDADFAVTIAGLQRIADKAGNRGITLSIELHDRSLADSSASLLRLLDGIGRANVGANPDLTNGYRAYDVPPESWQDALRSLAPRANLWHVNNMQRVYFPEIHRAAFVERPLGEGDIDYRWGVRLMHDARFDGWVVIEYKGTGDAFECISQGRAYMDRIMAHQPAFPRPG